MINIYRVTMVVVFFDSYLFIALPIGSTHVWMTSATWCETLLGRFRGRLAEYFC